VTSASVVDGECLAGIDTDTHLCGGVVRVFSGTCQNIGDQLADGHCSVNAVSFRIVRFGDYGMKPLIVKIHEHRVDTLEDAVHRAIMQIQEAKSTTVAGFSFNLGYVKHVRQVQDVCVQVDAINAIRHVARQIREIGVAHEFPDFDTLEGKLGNP